MLSDVFCHDLIILSQVFEVMAEPLFTYLWDLLRQDHKSLDIKRDHLLLYKNKVEEVFAVCCLVLAESKQSKIDNLLFYQIDPSMVIFVQPGSVSRLCCVKTLDQLEKASCRDNLEARVRESMNSHAEYYLFQTLALGNNLI